MASFTAVDLNTAVTTTSISTSPYPIPTTKTMTTTATPSTETTPTPRRTNFSNTYTLQSSSRQRTDTTLTPSSYNPYAYTTSTRDRCSFYSSGSGLEYFSSICTSIYGPTPTGSVGSSYTPHSRGSGSWYYNSGSYNESTINAHPFAIWKIILAVLVGFFFLFFSIGACFRLREKRRQRALEAEAAANGVVFPKQMEQLPTSYGQAGRNVGQLDQYGNVVRSTEEAPALDGTVIQPVERAHLRDETGNVPSVGSVPPVRNVWPGLR